MVARLFILSALCLALGACLDTAHLTPANAQAQAIGTPVLHFTRGLPFGRLKVVMPDGEVLPGSFAIDEAVTQGPPGTPPANFHASAAGPMTRLTCRGVVIAGHGRATCRSQAGAAYALGI